MKKITIGLFIDTYFPMVDGVTMVVDNYAKRLNKIANVIVFAPYYKNYNDDNLDYKVVRCKSINIPFLDYVLPLPHLDSNFKEILKNSNLDIVHVHSPATLGMIGIKYAKKHNIPVVGTMHSQYKKDIKRAVKFNFLTNILTHKVTNIYKKCDDMWAVNNEVSRIFKEEYGYPKYVKVAKNATEMKLINKNIAIETINKKHNIDKNDKVLLFVGRINKLKNIFFIIDSLKQITNLKYKMLFIGTGQDANDLIKYIDKMGLNDKVIMCGKVTDRKLLSYYYSRADLFLFPSLYDCNSIVQIEAASQKTPTLFIKGSVTSNWIVDNVNGFLEANNSKKYAKRIVEIFKNKSLYKKVCEQTYKDIYINWDDVIKEVYESYLNLIKEKN